MNWKKGTGTIRKNNSGEPFSPFSDLTQKYYSYLLTAHKSGEPARQYLKERGLNQALAKNYGLGFAPEGWDHLTTYLHQKKKIPLRDLEEAGLIIKGQGGKYYDRFRGRVIFPLHDHRGRVVGFSGRLLSSSAKEAKYINTPETAVYHKRYLLYGYHQNLDAIREKEAVIIMEGEFDVLSSVQAHVKNVVAIKGSALTQEQIRILSRTVKTIYLALDADNAGIAATSRAIELVQPFPVALRIIPLTGGKDPDDLARQDPKAWRETTDHHVSAFEYVLEATSRQQDLTTAQGQKVVTNTLLKLLLTIEHAVERSFYLKQLAEKLHVPEAVLEEDWERMRRRAQSDRVIPTRSAEKPAAPPPDPDRLGTYLWQLLLRADKPPATARLIASSWFADPAQQRLAEAYRQWWEDHDSFDLEKFARKLPAELQPVTSELYLADLLIEEKERERELLLVLSQIQDRINREHRQRIADDLAHLEQKETLTTDEQAAYEDLQREFMRMNQS